MISANSSFHKQKAETFVSAFSKVLAATYSRGIYKTTTIGKAAFDGRVRDGNGSDRSFMATKVNQTVIAALPPNGSDLHCPILTLNSLKEHS